MKRTKFAILFLLANFIAVSCVNAQTSKNEPKVSQTETKKVITPSTNQQHVVTKNEKPAPPKAKNESSSLHSDQATPGHTQENKSNSQELKSAPLSPR